MDDKILEVNFMAIPEWIVSKFTEKIVDIMMHNSNMSLKGNFLLEWLIAKVEEKLVAMMHSGDVPVKVMVFPE